MAVCLEPLIDVHYYIEWICQHVKHHSHVIKPTKSLGTAGYWTMVLNISIINTAIVLHVLYFVILHIMLNLVSVFNLCCHVVYLQILSGISRDLQYKSCSHTFLILSSG